MDEREKMIEQVCLTLIRSDHPTVTCHLLGGAKLDEALLLSGGEICSVTR